MPAVPPKGQDVRADGKAAVAVGETTNPST